MVARCTEEEADFIGHYFNIIGTLAGLVSFEAGSSVSKPPHSATAVVGNYEVYIPLEGLIDLGIEKARLEKRKDELENHIRGVEKKLGNAQFIERAPEQVVAREREKFNEMKRELEKVETNLSMVQ